MMEFDRIIEYFRTNESPKYTCQLKNIMYTPGTFYGQTFPELQQHEALNLIRFAFVCVVDSSGEDYRPNPNDCEYFNQFRNYSRNCLDVSRERCIIIPMEEENIDNQLFGQPWWEVIHKTIINRQINPNSPPFFYRYMRNEEELKNDSQLTEEDFEKAENGNYTNMTKLRTTLDNFLSSYEGKCEGKESGYTVLVQLPKKVFEYLGDEDNQIYFPEGALLLALHIKGNDFDKYKGIEKTIRKITQTCREKGFEPDQIERFFTDENTLRIIENYISVEEKKDPYKPKTP